MARRTLVLASIAGLIASPLTAAEFHHPEGPFVPIHDCTCRFQGEDVKLGERRCIRTSDGPRTAQCVMEQNVTSWRAGRDECPQASLVTPRG